MGRVGDVKNLNVDNKDSESIKKNITVVEEGNETTDEVQKIDSLENADVEVVDGKEEEKKDVVENEKENGKNTEEEEKQIKNDTNKDKEDTKDNKDSESIKKNITVVEEGNET